MSTVIRAGTDRDVSWAIGLWTQVLTARDGGTVADETAKRTWAAFSRPVLRFAVAGEPRQGFALTVTRRDGIALLSRICVHPSCTSRGLGAALVADAARHARAARCEVIELDVRSTNKRAIALYARAGFVVASEAWDYDGGDQMETWSLDLVSFRL